MANRQGKINRLKLKQMVEGWNGHRLPKNVSLKTLIEMVSDEAILTYPEEERSETHDRK